MNPKFFTSRKPRRPIQPPKGYDDPIDEDVEPYEVVGFGD